MSTKIYNGWRIEGVDVVGTLEKLRAFRKLVMRILGTALCRETARRAAFVIDSYRVTGRKTVVSPFPRRSSIDLTRATGSHFMFDTRERIIYDSFETGQKSCYAYECDVTLFPVRVGRKAFTLLLLFDNSVGSVYSSAFRRIFKPREYSYWDNTDPDSKVSGQEWEERGRVWDTVLGYASPSERGLTFSCVTKYAIPLVGNEHTFPMIPFAKFRLKKTYDYLVEQESIQRASTSCKDKPHTFSDILGEARRWLATPAGKRFKRQLWERSQRNIRSISMDDFRAPLKTYAREAPSDTKAAE